MIDAVLVWLLNNFTGLGSLVLSALLVFLYRQQKEILRVDKLPEIEISSRSFDGDTLEVVISNYGDGLAKNISYHTVVQVPDKDGFKPMFATSSARRMTEESERTLERSLRPHESQVKFEGVPRIKYQLEGRTRRLADFSTGFAQLNQDDIDSVWFQIYVVAEDQLGGCQMKPLFWPAQNPGDIAKHIDMTDERVDLETGYELGGLTDRDDMPEMLTPDCRE